MFIKLAHANRWKTALLCFSFLLCFTRLNLAGEESSPPLPNSTGAANYYEMKAGPYYTYLGVKGYQQTTDYTCGPAAVMSLLHWYNVLSDRSMNRETEMLIAGEMGTGDMNSNHPGTTPEKMVNWLQRNGFQATVGYNGTMEMLRENLRNRIPTMVEWIDWGGHWVVVTGYYAASESPGKGPDTIFFADPAVHWSSVNNPDGVSSFNTLRFQDMWFDAQYLKPGHVVRNVYIIAIPQQD